MTTSTFTIDHEKCDPSKWTPENVLALAKFLRTGELSYAAALARLGMKLERSEALEPAGGTLQFVGYVRADEERKPDFSYCSPGEEIDELHGYDAPDVGPIIPVYVGPAKFFGKGYEGNGGDEDSAWPMFEIFETEEEAVSFTGMLKQPPEGQQE